MARRADAPRDLLFGLLALQTGLITQAALVSAFHTWTQAKDRPMAEILVELAALDAARRALIEGLVGEHLKMHGGDPEKSLTALGAGPSTRESLARLGDPDLNESLARVGATHQNGDDDPWRTLTNSVGSSTSGGQRFRVVRNHAKGGLGEVFVAIDSEFNREVALKEIQSEHADDPVRRARFLQEAEITGRLEHPGIVPVYGLGSYADGRPYYAMRFIRGDSLKEAIAAFHADASLNRDPSRRSLELRQLLRRFLDVCNAIEYAHGRGVLHRDLKPGNIMVGRYGETLVVDWGLAKAQGKADFRSSERSLVPAASNDFVDTLPGSAIGTPAYMSPEQAAGELGSLGPRSDVYSLGATLYSLLTGKPPFAGGDIGAVLRAVGKGEFLAPRSIDPTLDRALEAVCLKAMAKKPEGRYASPRALADDVERWAADEPVTALPDSVRTRLGRWARRHKALVQVAGAAFILLGVSSAVAAILVNQARRSEIRQRSLTAEALVKADQQRQFAEKQSLEARQQTANLAFEQALEMCERGDVGHGILWMAHSLEITPPESTALSRLIRINLANWSRQLHIFTRAIWFGTEPDRMAISSDGKTVAIIHGAVARISDATNANKNGPPLEHRNYIGAVSFSPDGRMVATGSGDKTARVWDVATGKPLGPSLIHNGSVDCVAFSPDGRSLLTGSSILSDRGIFTGSQVRLWDSITGAEQRMLSESSGPIDSLVFRPDGDAVVIGSGGISRVWDISTRRPIEPPLIYQGLAVAFSPDGELLATKDDTGTARVCETSTGRPIGRPLIHGNSITSLAFRHDGAAIVTGGADMTARVWDARTGKPIGQPLLHRGNVLAAGFGPDGRTLLTCSGAAGDSKNQSVFWTTALDAPVSFPVSLKSYKAAISPDGRAIAIDTGRRSVQVYETATGKPMGRPVVHGAGSLANVAFRPDGAAILIAGRSVAQVWDLATGRPIGSRRKGIFTPRGSSLFSPDGKVIASLSVLPSPNRDARPVFTVHLWDATTGQSIGTPLGPRETIRAIAFRPDGRAVAVDKSADNKVRVLDVITARPLGPPLQTNDAMSAVAFSSDGKVIMTASDRAARLWDTTTGRPVGPALKHQKAILALAFSPDGSAVVTGSEDGTARVWDTATGRPHGPPLVHDSDVIAVEFRSDGKAIQTLTTRSTQRWNTGLAIEGKVEDISLCCQCITGMQVDGQGGTNVIEPFAWDAMARRLNELSEPPNSIMKTSNSLFDWHNWEAIKGANRLRSSELWHINKLLELQKDANIYVRRGDYYRARRLPDEAIADFERAIQNGIDDSSLRRKLAYLYIDSYRKRLGGNLLSSAVESLKKSERQFESLSDPSQSDYYDLACVRSLLSALLGRVPRAPSQDSRADCRKYADDALDALHLAVGAGYKDFAHMKNDPDIDSLRSRPDFQLMMMDLAFPGDPFTR